MDLYVFNELDSTSTEAQRMLRTEQGALQLPFAIQALKQHQGRGRRGRSWLSPGGNLYITVVYPGHQENHCDFCAESGPRLSALRAAWVMARLIENAISLRVTIKWPNDLYLYGAKIGGILVEASVSRQDHGVVWGPHLIGIGLNLQGTPEGLDGAAVLSTYTSLTDPTYWGQLVSQEFSRLWTAVPACQLVSALQSYGLSHGHPWIEGLPEEGGSHGSPSLAQAAEFSGEISCVGRLFLQEGLGKDGTLTLYRPSYSTADRSSPGTVDERVELSTSHHDWTWAYSHRDQKKGAKGLPMVVADIGNTRTKVAVFSPFDAPDPCRVIDTADPQDHEFRAQLAGLRGSLGAWECPWPLHVLSVNPAGKKVFFELCETLSFKPLTVAKRTTLLHPASGEFSYPFDQLGIDRMAAMEAFLAFLSPAERSPERLGVVVSAGTATTVDFVTTGGIHVGGVILPGLDFSLRCLHEKTGLLPRIYPQAARIRPGSSTSTALSQGVLAMTLGAVRELRRSLAPRFPLNDQCGGAGEGGVWGAGDLVVVTGGWGEMLSVQDPQWIWRPHLALCGGRFMVLSGG